ncbi:5525_t:CDS:2, partial [Acaulospora morrowiae]
LITFFATGSVCRGSVTVDSRLMVVIEIYQKEGVESTSVDALSRIMTVGLKVVFEFGMGCYY